MQSPDLRAGVGEHALTEFVDLSEGFRNGFAQRSRTDIEEAVTVVIDGGSSATTPALPDAVKESTQIIVVARFGRDVHDSVRVIAQLARRSGVPITAICTRRGSRSASLEPPDTVSPIARRRPPTRRCDLGGYGKKARAES